MSNPGDRFKKNFMPSPTGSPRGVNPGITMGVPRSSTWTICFSKTWKRNFYLHLPTLQSSWEKPKDFQDEDLYPDYEPELPELSDDDLDPHIQDAIEGSFDEYNTHYHQNKEAFEETERRAVEKDKAKKEKQEDIDYQKLQEFLAGRPRHIREPTFRLKIEKKRPSFMEALQEGLTCDPRSFGSSGQSTSDGRIRSTSFGSAQLSQPSSSVSAGRGQPSLFGSADQSTSAERGQSGSPSWSQLVQEDRRKRKDSSPPPPEKTKR